ncbi:MAG: hypothetical protein COB66_07285 [Coxiella sp. (in: Bacteria)]|nr:MAG: hypothetical protein COB66_07285 [Coxiella sp. (in: g-proteobacteria)]
MKSVLNILKVFYYQKLTKEAKLMYALTGLMFVLGLGMMIINDLTYHYGSILYFTSPWQRIIAPLLLLSGLVVYFQDIVSERLSLVIFTFTMYCLSLAAGLMLTQGIETTPFPTIDPWLLHADQVLGFNQTALMNFVYTHAWLKQIFIYGYNSLIPELTVLPLAMALMLRNRSVKVFLFAMLFSYPLGTLIFYFFPTTAPASVIHNIHFTFQEHDTFIKFYQMHHHMKITTTDGGLIAFPSFHVIWGVLLIYLARDKKWLLYPLLLWNSVLIGSTMALGWHYLIDVIAGITIAGSCLYLGERVYAWCNNLSIKKKALALRLTPSRWAPSIAHTSNAKPQRH